MQVLIIYVPHSVRLCSHSHELSITVDEVVSTGKKKSTVRFGRGYQIQIPLPPLPPFPLLSLLPFPHGPNP